MITITLPLKTQRGQNDREHHMAKHRRVTRERSTAKLLMMSAARKCPLPVIVTLTRISAGTLDDDNNQGALKGVRDGIADAFGVDDGGDQIKWQYAQAKCKRGEYGVQVTIEPLTPEINSGTV